MKSVQMITLQVICLYLFMGLGQAWSTHPGSRFGRLFERPRTRIGLPKMFHDFYSPAAYDNSIFRPLAHRHHGFHDPFATMAPNLFQHHTVENPFRHPVHSYAQPSFPRVRKFDVVSSNEKLQLVIESPEVNKNGLFSVSFDERDHTLVVKDRQNPRRFHKTFTVPEYVKLEDFEIRYSPHSFTVEMKTNPVASQVDKNQPAIENAAPVVEDASLDITADSDFEVFADANDATYNQNKVENASAGYIDTTGVFREY